MKTRKEEKRIGRRMKKEENEGGIKTQTSTSEAKAANSPGTLLFTKVNGPTSF
jgi:hypothetical protein